MIHDGRQQVEWSECKGAAYQGWAVCDVRKAPSAIVFYPSFLSSHLCRGGGSGRS